MRRSSMKLIIAEKPSVAETIAHSVGAREKVYGNDGKTFCYSGNNYYVAYAAGHLYGLGMPEDYGFKEWNIDDLPFFPEFSIHATDEKKDELRNFLSEIINRSDVDELVCATDAGREGELIFRHIYYANNCTKPVKRLWINSVTDEAIREGMEHLKPMSDFDNMYTAAFTREKLDWLIGMNLSRLYGIADKYAHRIGRVKTPLLNIIVERDNEIKNFKSTTSYRLQLANGAVSKDEFANKADCEAKAAESNGNIVKVIKAEKQEKSENRPELYSLAALQMDANDLYGLSASETLEIAQSLYEKKLTTYPRTDSRYIPEDLKPEIEKIVEKLKDKEEYSDRIQKLLSNGLSLDNRLVDNNKITDHHAIIPTENVLSNVSLSDNERKVYEMIINRLLMGLDKKYRYSEMTYEFECCGIVYELVCKTPIELGWKQFRPRYEEDTEDKEIISYAENDTFSADVTIKECITQPKKHFTDKSLISVMENIDNRISDKSLKEAVSGKGIGTSATRAGIIEELIKADYITRKGKQLCATDFGIEFIESLPDNVKSVERTAEWEQCFDNIQQKGISPDKLTDDVVTFIKTTVAYEKSRERKPLNHENPNAPKHEILGKCPRCGKNIYEGKANYYCESGKDGCGFSIWKQSKYFLTDISPNMAIELLKGNAVKLKAKNKEDEIYTSEYVLDDTGTYVNFKRLQKERVSLGKCPRCGKNIYEGKANYYCESGKDGCGFSIWKEDKFNGITVSAKNVSDLLSKGKTNISKKTLNGTIKSEYCLEDTGKYVNLRKDE